MPFTNSKWILVELYALWLKIANTRLDECASQQASTYYYKVAPELTY